MWVMPKVPTTGLMDDGTAIKGRIESLIDNTYYISYKFAGRIFAVITMKMFKNRNLRPHGKVVRNEMRRINRFFHHMMILSGSWGQEDSSCLKSLISRKSRPSN